MARKKSVHVILGIKNQFIAELSYISKYYTVYSIKLCLICVASLVKDVKL